MLKVRPNVQLFVWLLIRIHFRMCKLIIQSDVNHFCCYFFSQSARLIGTVRVLQPLLPARIMCVRVNVCMRVSVGQSERQQRRRVQRIGRLLATAVPLVGTDPAGSLWVGEHK